LKGAKFYCNGYGQPTPFWQTQQIAADVREIAIGYFKVYTGSIQAIFDGFRPHS
jgi:hypothetical protein